MMKFKDLNLNFSACGFLFQQNNSMYVLLTKREVKVTGYWHNEANIKPLIFVKQSWSLRNLLYGQKENFFMRDWGKKTRANKMGSLARNSSISNHTNATSHLPIEHFSHLFFSMFLVNKSEY